jgi:hypothetical protein
MSEYIENEQSRKEQESIKQHEDKLYEEAKRFEGMKQEENRINDEKSREAERLEAEKKRENEKHQAELRKAYEKRKEQERQRKEQERVRSEQERKDRERADQERAENERKNLDERIKKENEEFFKGKNTPVANAMGYIAEYNASISMARDKKEIIEASKEYERFSELVKNLDRINKSIANTTDKQRINQLENDRQIYETEMSVTFNIQKNMPKRKFLENKAVHKTSVDKANYEYRYMIEKKLNQLQKNVEQAIVKYEQMMKERNDSRNNEPKRNIRFKEKINQKDISRSI